MKYVLFELLCRGSNILLVGINMRLNSLLVVAMILVWFHEVRMPDFDYYLIWLVPSFRRTRIFTLRNHLGGMTSRLARSVLVLYWCFCKITKRKSACHLLYKIHSFFGSFFSLNIGKPLEK